MQWRYARGFVWLLPLCAVLVVFVTCILFRWPMLGHDYEVFFRYLAAGRWHAAHAGLWPLRYAAQLCGGLPLYGHPNDVFYSLPQLLSLVFDPLQASIVSVVCFLTAGYVGWYRFGRDVLAMQRHWSHVLALVICAHGFHLTHALIGHLNFSTMPLLGWLLWLVCAGGMRLPIRSAAFGLLSALILHTAGAFTLLFFAMTFVLFLPCYALLRSPAAPSVGIVLQHALFCAGAATVLCGSKLIAVASLMRTFPRVLPMNTFAASVDPLPIIAASLWAVPQRTRWLLGAPWGLHENSLFLSPVTLIGIAIGVSILVRCTLDRATRTKAVLAWVLVAFIAWCAVNVASGGVLASLLRGVPLLSAVRVMMRLLYPATLLICIGAVLACNHVARTRAWLAACALVLTALCFPLAYFPYIHEFDVRPQPEQVLRQVSSAISSGAFWQPVSRVIDGDTDFSGSTGGQCSGDALFQSVGWQRIPVLRIGPVEQVDSDGRVNMVNPSCYAYAPANACPPGSKIRAEDTQNLHAFLHGRPTAWLVSPAQQAADVLTLAGLTLSLLILARVAWRWCIVRIRS